MGQSKKVFSKYLGIIVKILWETVADQHGGGFAWREKTYRWIPLKASNVMLFIMHVMKVIIVSIMNMIGFDITGDP